ncbi:hypothetical protein RvY_05757 [Ramazzottius varieornatus]|uniref:Uncharacterized protein n=1 Tax=Ramazzottius varieornatus TaxID=947166 RepID=A0A1D1V546_RAMVA|nr:hypothetical protein RvY_05757 [Ramazzottius varieornatus]
MENTFPRQDTALDFLLQCYAYLYRGISRSTLEQLVMPNYSSDKWARSSTSQLKITSRKFFEASKKLQLADADCREGMSISLDADMASDPASSLRTLTLSATSDLQDYTTSNQGNLFE